MASLAVLSALNEIIPLKCVLVQDLVDFGSPVLVCFSGCWWICTDKLCIWLLTATRLLSLRWSMWRL